KMPAGVEAAKNGDGFHPLSYYPAFQGIMAAAKVNDSRNGQAQLTKTTSANLLDAHLRSKSWLYLCLAGSGALLVTGVCLALGLLLCAGMTAEAADIDALVKQLKAKDTDARRQAVKALAEAGQDARSATPALLNSLKDSDLFVRRFAAQALGDIEADPKAAVP